MLHAGNPNVFYYVSDGTEELYSLNISTGVSTLIGSTGVTSIEAIAYYPFPGANVLYAANGGDFGTLNLSTGAYTSIGEIDGGGTANGAAGAQTLNDVDGLMLDGQTFKMWAIERQSGATPDLLFQIDVSTGQFVPNAFGPGIDYLVISGTGIDVDADDLAVDPTTGIIYASSNDGGTNDVLIRINKFTGVFTFVANLSQDDVEGLAFRNDGTLYGSEGDGDNRFSEINKSTGVMSNFIGFSGSDVEALASLVADANQLSGTVYEDTNYDGIKDGGELGVAGVRLYLYIDKNGDGNVDPEDTKVQETVTDGNGDYSFLYASTGNLLVTTKFNSYPFGYALTTDNVESASFTDGVNFGETDNSNDFGIATGPDCDGDGLPNFFEGGADSDLDAVPDSCDLDSDNDGILDSVEGIEDFDDDGVVNYLDRDSDDDGIPDAIEATGGIVTAAYESSEGNFSGADLDGNGIVDSRETFSGSGVMIASRPDSDNDGLVDYLDLDSDNDGILDIIEAGGTDSDGDGQVDTYADGDNNGYYDLYEETPLLIPNTDETFENNNGLTNRPNYIDIDSDADGIDDTREGYSTAAYEFPTLLIDFDEDGIIDFWDVSADEEPITPYDKDGDGTPDYQDDDSDNDNVSDLIEGNDADSDGVADAAVTGNDDNGNGLDDAFDNNCAQTISIGAADWGEEDNSDGSMNLSSTDLELVNDGGTNQTVGVYFSGVAVEQGATINSAYVQFETDEAETGAINITIEGQLSTNASTFTTGVNNVSSRTTTVASESWSPANWNTVGEAGANQRTVDISSIIQEIVNQGGWSSGNSLVLIFTGPSGNTRTAEVDPTLVINLDAIVCSSNVAVQDFDGDGERDWRDIDDDDDGIATISEIPDSEPSGVPDYLEVDAGPCGVGAAVGTATVNGNADVATNESGVPTAGNAAGAPDGSVALIHTNGNTILLDLSDTIPAGSNYTIRWQERTGESGTAQMILEESIDGVNFTTHPSAPTTNSTTLVDAVVTANVTTRYLRISKDNPPSTTDFEVDAVSYNTQVCSIDSDNDGIPDEDDIDDDNDGVLDVDEEASCRGEVNFEYYDGTPSGNTVDNIPTINPDASGTVSSFDVDDLTTNLGVSNQTYGVRFTGFITISTTETYTFYTSSDDGSKLYIDGVEIVDNDGLQSQNEESGTVALTPGSYAITVEFFENNGDEILEVSYSSPSISKTEIPFSVLSTGSGGCDTDQDGIVNRLDLDSDNDGIADIIEAEGEDEDNNGRVDDPTDTDGDGWADTFDSDDGGTALNDPDTDGDGLNNRIDIDADNDGIIDVVEAQASTSSPRLPSGIDTDGDGTDDTFDNDIGPSFLIPIDTDGDGSSDYVDTDADDDGSEDLIEGWDTDNNGVADTSPTGLDDDNDGLDNAFDVIDGWNSGTNVSNDGTTSDDFPNLDRTNTPERDWRELLDSDGDGIADVDDIDDDNDGILDVEENSSCTAGSTNSLAFEFYDLEPAGNSVDNIPTTGALATGSVTEFDVDALYMAVDPGDGDDFSIRYTGYIKIATAGTYTFYTSSDDGSKLYLDGNEVVDNDGDHGIQERSGSILLGIGTYPIEVLFYEDGGGEFLSVSYQGPSIAKTALPFNILTEGGVCDTDGDGINDQIDLDSDNDGIPDIIEAGGEDSDNDGRVDDDTDSNNDGWADTFDSNFGGTALEDGDQDNDGFENRIDLDSDDDGIADIIEAGGVDANGDGKGDSSTDFDEDGWTLNFDEDEGGSTLTIGDSDADGLPNYLDLDSDNDGITDNVEGQTTVEFVAPLGTDTDEDGWDDRYDSDDGGTAISLSNNDGVGEADYLDNDSDGDGLPDWIEGFDDNNTEDALDDLLDRANTFETVNGNPGYYDNSLDSDMDGIPNWLEDDDMDNIPNAADADNGLFRDTNQDGIIDLFDPVDGGGSSNLPDGDGDGEYDFRDTDNQISLPIELIRFDALPHKGIVKLQWTTQSEINNDYFIIEKRNNKGVFESIGKIDGAGNSNRVIDYESFDYHPNHGANYYRLKQVDFDGKYAYSSIQVVFFNSSDNWSVYPNPSNGNYLFIDYEVQKNLIDPILIEIYTSKGKLIYSTQIFNSELDLKQLNVLKNSTLSKGVFILKLRINKNVKTRTFIVN